MKISLKKAIAAVLTAGSALVGVAAHADTALPSSGNGELVLYVFDATNGTSYARGLGVNVDSYFTNAQIAGDSTYVAGKSLSFSFGTIGPDANLTTFLSHVGGADTVTWAVLAGDSLLTTTGLGNQRYITTSTTALTATSTASNSQLKTVYNQLNGLQGSVNAQINTGVFGDGASTQPQGVYGTQDTNAAGWYGAGPNNGIAFGSASAANFYLVTDAGGTNTTKARFYTLGGLTLSATGVLTQAGAASTVPLPAAVWLLGSGLLGLLGVGRRKQG